MDTCSSCRFYFKYPNGAGPPDQGMCRRYPPLPVLIGMAQPSIAGQPARPMVNGFFPPQSDSATCGEHKPRTGAMQIDMTKLAEVLPEGQA